MIIRRSIQRMLRIIGDNDYERIIDRTVFSDWNVKMYRNSFMSGDLSEVRD